MHVLNTKPKENSLVYVYFLFWITFKFILLPSAVSFRADDADSQPRPDQCGQIVKGRKHQRGTKKHQKKHIMFLGTKTLALPCIFIAFSTSIFDNFQIPATQAEKKVYGKDFLEFFV